MKYHLKRGKVLFYLSFPPFCPRPRPVRTTIPGGGVVLYGGIDGNDDGNGQLCGIGKDDRSVCPVHTNLH